MPSPFKSLVPLAVWEVRQKLVLIPGFCPWWLLSSSESAGFPEGVFFGAETSVHLLEVEAFGLLFSVCFHSQII